MTALERADSIPRFSVWLQENLKDMEVKVKRMIGLIEEDADSFASRAEMYYNKRPVLIELVEEFFRSYRALAGRYDHATGAIRQAHQIMAEAVPNEVPAVFVDKSHVSSRNDADRHTLSASEPLLDPHQLSKDVSNISTSLFPAVKRKGAFANDSEATTNKKEVDDILISGEQVKHSNCADGKVGVSLRFHDASIRHGSAQRELEACVLYESDSASKSEAEVLARKEILAKLQAEREASGLQYQHSLERFSNLELDVSRAHEGTRRLNELANKAEEEIGMIKKMIIKLDYGVELQKQKDVKSVGINTDCTGLSVKELQEENTKLKEICYKQGIEKVLLMEKLDVLEKLNENSKKLSNKNQNSVSSLLDAKAEFDILKANFKNLEDSFLSLDDGNLSAAARENLSYILNTTQQAVEDLERWHVTVIEKHTAQEKRRKTSLQIIKELKLSFDAETKELARSFKKLFEEVERCNDQEKQILVLIETCDHQSKENESLSEANKELESELHKLLKEIHQNKISIEMLKYEQKKGEDAYQLLETKAEVVLCDLQSSVLRKTLFQEKMRDLTEACLNLEAANDARAIEIDLLNRKISELIDENGEVKSQLAAYIPVVTSLRDSVACLESHTLHHRKPTKDETNVFNFENNYHDRCHDRIQKDLLSMEHKAIVEMEKLPWRGKLEVLMKQTEDLKFKSKGIGVEQNKTLVPGFSNEVRPEKPIPENHGQEDEDINKDVALDHISECSSHRTSKHDLEETGNAINKLSDINSNIGSAYFLTEGKSAIASDERASLEEKISTEARVASEKIGQLQFELQILEADMLKSNREKETEGKTRISRKIKRAVQKQSKALFFNCFRLGTKGK